MKQKSSERLVLEYLRVLTDHQYHNGTSFKDETVVTPSRDIETGCKSYYAERGVFRSATTWRRAYNRVVSSGWVEVLNRKDEGKQGYAVQILRIPEESPEGSIAHGCS